MKMIKVRATTIGKQRALGIAGESASGTVGGGEVMQGMYSFAQTEVYRPPPVVNVGNFWLGFVECC